MLDSESPKDLEEETFMVNEIELGVAEKISILFIWLLIETIGNGMLCGLIHFDLNAGDPLKRRISDQVERFFLTCMERNVTFSQTYFFSFCQ